MIKMSLIGLKKMFNDKHDDAIYHRNDPQDIFMSNFTLNKSSTQINA